MNLGTYHTKTYIAASFDHDKDAVDKLYEWNENDRFSLNFKDVHELAQCYDSSNSNALIHRDYTDRMDEVTIFIYKDRLEITNSGEMPSGIMISKNKFKQHGSVLRNPLMAEVFYIAGKMEKTGRGLQLISGKMKELGVKLPEWKCENGKTCLTIFKTTTKRAIPERAQKFLSSCRKGDSFGKRDYMQAFEKSISETSAKNDLSAMVDMGVVEQVGRGPSTRYVVK